MVDVLSHHHPDHTVNIGLLPNARVHLDALHTQRPGSPEVADLIVPGHGAPFEVAAATPR